MLVGLRETRGRWEACIEEGSRQAKLLFSSKEDAAKAYDKAQFKLYGDGAATNFALSEDEKEDVSNLEWEDLILNLQLQGLPKATLSGLAFHGVLCKDEVWQTYVKIGKQRYVGRFTSMMEAVNAYDMVEYKIHGSDGLLNYDLAEDEVAELEKTDWNSLISNLGLKIYERRKPHKTGYRGVRQVAPGKWSASYAHRGASIQLGRFESLDAAVRSYDSFVYKLCGEAAKLNGALSDDEKDQLCKLSLKEVRAALAVQAIRPPSSADLGARGARFVGGKWEVCVESTMRDSLFLTTTINEAEATQVHDIAAYKLHKDFAKTYSELSLELREQIDSVEWATVAENFGFQRLPSYYGVRRLVSGMWQSFIRYGGSYLPVGTFASAEMAAHASDMCTYKLGGNSSGTLYNFPLEGFEKKKIEKLQWCQLIASLREEQEWSAHTTELADMEAASAVDEKHLSRDKRWILFVCQEQLIQQRMMRRASRVGQQIIVRRPELAEQFSPLNRRADGSPMLVEEVMECNSAPLLWTCQCGNLFLKSPASLAKIKPVCHQPGCTSVSRDRFSGSLN